MTRRITKEEAEQLDRRLEGMEQRLDRIDKMLATYAGRPVAAQAKAARRGSLTLVDGGRAGELADG